MKAAEGTADAAMKSKAADSSTLVRLRSCVSCLECEGGGKHWFQGQGEVMVHGMVWHGMMFCFVLLLACVAA